MRIESCEFPPHFIYPPAPVCICTKAIPSLGTRSHLLSPMQNPGSSNSPHPHHMDQLDHSKQHTFARFFSPIAKKQNKKHKNIPFDLTDLQPSLHVSPLNRITWKSSLYSLPPTCLLNTVQSFTPNTPPKLLVHATRELLLQGSISVHLLCPIGNV